MGKKKFFALFLLCALVPLAAAKLSLAMGWFSDKAANRGKWLDEEVYPLLPAKVDAHKWMVVYSAGENCADECRDAAYTLQQFYSGLGMKQDRVSVAIIARDSPRWLKQFPDLQWRLPSSSTRRSQHQLLLLNPQGLALLSYEFSAEAKLAQVSADMRKDILHLLKYDREGL